MLGIFLVSWTNEWLILGPRVLANRDITSAQVFSSRETWEISNSLMLASFSLARLTYFCENWNLAYASPRICETTNSESVLNLRHSSHISSTNDTPAMTASYSTWLLVVGNLNLNEISIMSPHLFSKMTSAPLPQQLDDQFAKNT